MCWPLRWVKKCCWVLSQESCILKCLFLLIDNLTYACNDIDQVLLLFLPSSSSFVLYTTLPSQFHIYSLLFLSLSNLRHPLHCQDAHVCGNIPWLMGPHPDALSLSSRQLSAAPQLGVGLLDDPHPTPSLAPCWYFACLDLVHNHSLYEFIYATSLLYPALFKSPLSNAMILP